ncbi:MAG: phosphate ABC transporter permease subunit PstC [Pseudomonadales bacterium]|nr:phosphate ABC transporter permease subunit PstC [Pseudomonadales bacterium]
MYRHKVDIKFVGLLRLLVMLAACIVLLIFGFLLTEAWPFLFSEHGGQLFTDAVWHPTTGQYNLVPVILGTLYTTIGAVSVAVPFALATAIFCQFYAPRWFGRLYTSVMEVLAGIPSVVYGFWGLVVLVPLVASWQGSGASLLTGILVLSLMILPTGTLLAIAALKQVPSEWIQGSYALGLSRWATIKNIALPASGHGMLNALLLQSTRAIGETMAVLMVCGNSTLFPFGLFEPVRTLSANIALEMAYAMEMHRAALYSSALVLMVMVFILLFLNQFQNRLESTANGKS